MNDNTVMRNLLTRGVVDVVVKQDLENLLKSNKKLRIKLGIDPTGSDLHLGHMVVIRKLREFQELGHKIVLIFGNFTGQIGDPTGKMESRTMRTQAELEKNAEKYLDQVKILLDVKRVEVRWNAEWLSPLSFSDVVQLASNFTVMQMLERDMFQERIKKDLPISLHEFLYPLMQGYDSVVIKSNVELGGTEQLFNLLAGRTLQKAYRQMPQQIMTLPILVGLDGAIKMGKSENNYIGIQDEPNDMYGKVMSIPDHLILPYFELASDASVKELSDISADLKRGTNPRDVKMKLAKNIVSIYHSSQISESAERYFVEFFQKKKLPVDIPEIKLQAKVWNIVDIMIQTGLAPSKSEARRLIEQHAVTYNNKKIFGSDDVVEIADQSILQVGKRRVIKISSAS